MAGVYFAFSAFVMRALAAIPSASGVASMQAINRWILSSAFMPLFFATTLLSLGLVATLPFRSSEPGHGWAMAAAGVYLLGMFAVTAFANVPLNRVLEQADPAALETADVWQHYLQRWTQWNHLRTLASALASALFLSALVSRAANGTFGPG